MACLPSLWHKRVRVTLFFLCWVATADPVDPPSLPVVSDISAADRVLAGTSASIGAAAGAFIGGSMALGFSALLSGLDPRASLLPLLVLPPLCTGLGTFVTAAALVDTNVAVVSGAAATGATTLWAIGLALLLVDDPDRLLSFWGQPGRFDLTFAATALGPALVGVVIAGLSAPWFVPDP